MPGSRHDPIADSQAADGVATPPARDPGLRAWYLRAAIRDAPRLLGSIDRNPYHSTYGCFDRQFWHYRTAAFPSEMYQEGVLTLALLYAYRLPGNVWFGEPRLRDLALAGMRFAARSCHTDGSCDDYYPFERALGAAVFSLQAAARACQVLAVDEAELTDWLVRRADWVAGHDESGRLANHHALAALGLWRVAEITGRDRFRQAARERIAHVLAWQSDEGWFEEYGGADPGYQTVTIDCLAKLRRATGDTSLDEPLARAVSFARLFLHPDGSYGGEYGSRGTYHFYPHGMELLACQHAAAADLADGFLQSLAQGTSAVFGDDRLYVHRLANLIEAYLDWSPSRPGPEATTSIERYLSEAQIFVRRSAERQTIISAARGGVFKHYAAGRPAVSDAGLIVELADGRTAVTQVHHRGRHTECHAAEQPSGFSVSGLLDWVSHETATPLKQAVFHVGMALVGRWCRTLIRRLLQRRLITGRRECPIRHTRQFEWLDLVEQGPTLRVTDTVELLDDRLQVRELAIGPDHQTVYVAASGVYQPSALLPWLDLKDHVEPLNRQRRAVILREI